jgi:hypothetical protein
MLSQDDRQRLVAIETALRAEDPDFAAALREGQPCPPREYRHRSHIRGTLLCLLVALALIVAIAAGAMLG